MSSARLSSACIIVAATNTPRALPLAPFEPLRDVQRAAIVTLVDADRPRGGKPVDLREVVDGIRWVLHTQRGLHDVLALVQAVVRGRDLAQDRGLPSRLRLEDIYARDGMEPSRSTMCGWHEQVAHLAEPVFDAMLRDAFTQPYLCADATGVLVKTKEQCQRRRLRARTDVKDLDKRLPRMRWARHHGLARPKGSPEQDSEQRAGVDDDAEGVTTRGRVHAGQI